MRNAKKILLITKKNPDFDTYISLQVLAEVIKLDLNKPVELASEAELPKTFQEAVPMPEIKKMTSLPPKSFILEFKNQDNKVKNIQWNQSADKISLYVTMQQGNLKHENMNVQVTGADHDLIIIVGVNTLEELGALYANSKNIFDEARVQLFSLKPGFKLPQLKTAEADKVSSISEQVFAYLDANGVKLTNVRASRLLSGLFSATDNFKKNVRDARTYEVAARLTRLGATNEAGSNISGKVKSAAGEKAVEGQKPQQQSSNQQPKSSGESAQNKPTDTFGGYNQAKQAEQMQSSSKY